MVTKESDTALCETLIVSRSGAAGAVIGGIILLWLCTRFQGRAQKMPVFPPLVALEIGITSALLVSSGAMSKLPYVSYLVGSFLLAN